MIKDKDAYQFIAKDAEAEIPYEFVLHDERPVKLGDGTFGCVFHVRGRNENCALKIFYKSSDSFVTKSQESEMTIGEKLRQHYIDDHSTASALNTYLVVPIGYVEEFQDSDAYKTLKDYFTSLSFKISDKALVMEYFPMSLKDLLERGWPETKQNESQEINVGRGAGGKFGDKSGYNVLSSLTQLEKERCILPFIQDIAEGLSILHGPDYKHQDIKPANVLVRQVRGNISAAVADLGFIDTGTWQVHGSIHQNRPLGTRHYRSPEQTDYFDLCEVDVKKNGSGYELTTRDPKFLNTFSEKGDLVVFAKLPKPFQWEITDIEIPDSGSRDGLEKTPITIKIKGLNEIQLEDDERTQISVHKKQTLRTDLFGLGAIAYDMVTCGGSPEQFYDLLRAHDRADKSINSGLAQRYLHFKNGGGTIPEIDAIFQSLRVDVGSEFPSLAMVKIILKCMMSRTEDSYFSLGTDDKGEGATKKIWRALRKDLEVLEDEIGSGENYRRVETNYLLSPSRVSGKTPPPDERSPGVKLRDIQNLSYTKAEECTERVVEGYVYFEKIARMIVRELIGGVDVGYLMDVSPDNLHIVKGEYSPQYAFFETKKELDDLLASGNPKVVLQTFSSGCLLPPFMNALVRECEIWIDDKENGNGSAFWVHIDPWGPDHGWPHVSAGDRLSCNLSSTVTMNATISAQKEGMLELQNSDEDAFRSLEDWKKYRAMVVRRFTPTDYYVGMLGTYIRQIFFVNPSDRREFIPREAFVLEEGRPKGWYVEMEEEEEKAEIPPEQGGTSRTSEVVAAFGSMVSRMRRGADLRGNETVEPGPIESSQSDYEKRVALFLKRLIALYLKLVTRQMDGKWEIKGFSLTSDNPAGLVAQMLRDLEGYMKEALDIPPDRNIVGEERKLIERISANGHKLKEFPDIGRLCGGVVEQWRQRK